MPAVAPMLLAAMRMVTMSGMDGVVMSVGGTAAACAPSCQVHDCSGRWRAPVSDLVRARIFALVPASMMAALSGARARTEHWPAGAPMLAAAMAQL